MNPPPPRPTCTLVSRYRTTHGRTITAIFREWKPEDVEDGRCPYCPECVADQGKCLIQIDRFVANEDAPTYSLVGKALRRADA